MTIENLKAELAKPICGEDISSVDDFDPWELFPAVYGCYSSAFDDMALEVLASLIDKTFPVETLAHEMFREMLCTAGLCDYGSSPRVCFPTAEFSEVLPSLRYKWAQYADAKWNQPARMGMNGDVRWN